MTKPLKDLLSERTSLQVEMDRLVKEAEPINMRLRYLDRLIEQAKKLEGK